MAMCSGFSSVSYSPEFYRALALVPPQMMIGERPASSSEESSQESVDNSVELGNPRYKTQMCKSYNQHTKCVYGHMCKYAHGERELRLAPRNEKYKTKICKSYWNEGHCVYGPRCNFVHSEDKKVLISAALQGELSSPVCSQILMKFSAESPRSSTNSEYDSMAFSRLSADSLEIRNLIESYSLLGV